MDFENVQEATLDEIKTATDSAFYEDVDSLEELRDELEAIVERVNDKIDELEGFSIKTEDEDPVCADEILLSERDIQRGK